MIAAYILIQTEAGQAAIVAAALRGLPGVSQTASLAGPYDVIARAQARDIDELAKLVALRVQALDGVTRTMAARSSTSENRSPWITTPPSTRWARAASRRSAHAVGAARCSARTKRPARWTRYSARPMLAICTMGDVPAIAATLPVITGRGRAALGQERPIRRLRADDATGSRPGGHAREAAMRGIMPCAG